MVYVVGLEFVQNGHCNSAIGYGGNKGYGPLCRVLAADGNFVVFFYSGAFKCQMEFGHLACYVAILV